MKIQNILIAETFDFGETEVGDASDVTPFKAPKISVSDLDSLQLNTLHRLRDGRVTIDSANDRELDIIMDLIEIGLVDADGNITDSGQEAGEVPDINKEIEVPADDSEQVELPDDEYYDDNEDIDFSIDKAF